MMALVAVFAFVIAARLPFLSDPMLGEEGMLARLVIGPGPFIRGDDVLIVARLDGIPVMLHPGRTVVPYQILDNIVRPAFGTADINGLSIAQLSRAGRTAFLALFVLACVVLLPLALRTLREAPENSWVVLALVAYALTTPLAVGGSVQLMLDGTLAPLLAGSAAWLLLMAERQALAGRLAFGLASGVVISLGKNEWTLAFVAALGVGYAVQRLAARRSGDQQRLDGVLTAAALAGTVVAAIAIQLWTPATFLSGFDTMQRIANAPVDRFSAFREVLGLTYPVFALGIAGGLLGWRLWPGIVLRQFPLFVIFLWAAAITAGYSYSGWFPDGFPRYFIPALFLFLMFLIMALRRVELRHGATWFLVSLCIAGLVANAATLGRNYTRGRSINSYYGVSFAESKARFAREAAQFRIDGQPIFSDSVIDLYYPGVDWVSSSLGVEGANDLLRRRRPAFTGHIGPPE